MTPPLSRRTFAAASVALGATPALAASLIEVAETDVSITTPDGTCDAALFAPARAGSWPAVVIFTDALGLRPVFRDMGKRMASAGYVVLIPNPFYRSRKAPVFTGPFDFASPTDRAKLTELRAPITPDTVGRDTLAYLKFLASQKVVKRGSKIGVVGYCMGGPMTMQAAAIAPSKIAAACSFHGGGLVTDKPDSPHLLVPNIKADFYFGVATNDDQREPEAKTRLKAAFDAAKRPARIEVYEGAMHGWCVPGSQVYNAAQAERAWSEMLALYKRVLVA